MKISRKFDTNFPVALPEASRHATQIPNLWHIGASTHPGAGLGGGSGHLVAQQLTRMTRLLRRR